MKRKRDLMERFDEKWIEDPVSGCHLWTAATHSAGYGVIGTGVGRQVEYAHRISYERTNGKIPEGMYVDHMCRVRSCINPRHLRAVTPRVNALENSDSPFAKNAVKTHCVHGHLFDEENTYIRPDNGGRMCLACVKTRAKEGDLEAKRQRKLVVNARYRAKKRAGEPTRKYVKREESKRYRARKRQDSADSQE